MPDRFGEFGERCAAAWQDYRAMPHDGWFGAQDATDRMNAALASLIAAQAREAFGTARPLSEWHDDIGDALWWHFPIQEPPYVGSPLCDDFIRDGYHTHWTPLVAPIAPADAEGVRDVEDA